MSTTCSLPAVRGFASLAPGSSAAPDDLRLAVDGRFRAPNILRRPRPDRASRCRWARCCNRQIAVDSRTCFCACVPGSTRNSGDVRVCSVRARWFTSSERLSRSRRTAVTWHPWSCPDRGCRRFLRLRSRASYRKNAALSAEGRGGQSRILAVKTLVIRRRRDQRQPRSGHDHGCHVTAVRRERLRTFAGPGEPRARTEQTRTPNFALLTGTAGAEAGAGDRAAMSVTTSHPKRTATRVSNAVAKNSARGSLTSPTRDPPCGAQSRRQAPRTEDRRPRAGCRRRDRERGDVHARNRRDHQAADLGRLRRPTVRFFLSY